MYGAKSVLTRPFQEVTAVSGGCVLPARNAFIQCEAQSQEFADFGNLLECGGLLSMMHTAGMIPEV
jgi:hypothetical protein